LPRFYVRRYQTFADLQSALETAVRVERWDAIIHCAAVSDYLSAGAYAPAAQTRFDPNGMTWKSTSGAPAMTDRIAGKIKSDHAELWLRLVSAPKLVDQIRSPWGFTGKLVKFKLEAAVDETALIETAERSRIRSGADLMVANTLEAATECAFIGPVAGGYERVARGDLPPRLFIEIERLLGG
jgi:phosphopantothenate-cysteine ligase